MNDQQEPAEAPQTAAPPEIPNYAPGSSGIGGQSPELIDREAQVDHANSADLDTLQAKPDTPPAEPPVENPHTPALDAPTSMYDDPEWQKHRAEGIAQQIEGWKRDWKGRVEAIMEGTGLSRPETLAYLQMLQVGALRGIAQGFQDLWNGNPFQARRQREDELTQMQHMIARTTLGIDEKGEPQLVHQGRPPWKIQ